MCEDYKNFVVLTSQESLYGDFLHIIIFVIHKTMKNSGKKMVTNLVLINGTSGNGLLEN